MGKKRYHVIINAGPDDCMAIHVKDYCFECYEEAKKYFDDVLSNEDTYFKDIYDVLSGYIDEDEIDQDESEEDEEGEEDNECYLGYSISIIESSIELFETGRLRSDSGNVDTYGVWYQEYGLTYDNMAAPLIEIYMQLGAQEVACTEGILWITPEEIKESMGVVSVSLR